MTRNGLTLIDQLSIESITYVSQDGLVVACANEDVHEAIRRGAWIVVTEDTATNRVSAIRAGRLQQPHLGVLLSHAQSNAVLNNEIANWHRQENLVTRANEQCEYPCEFSIAQIAEALYMAWCEYVAPLRLHLLDQYPDTKVPAWLTPM